VTRRWSWRGLSPATRVATGLVSLMLSLVMIADLIAGFLPDRRDAAAHSHTITATRVTTQLTRALRSGDPQALQEALSAAVGQQPSLRSGAIVSIDGSPLALVGDHEHGWELQPGDASTLTNVHSPIIADGQPWGELQLVFRSTRPDSLIAWLRDPLVQGLLLASLLGFVSFQLYLRRVLHHLDPNSAVPERVRSAFDTLTESVLVLDADGNVLLANKAFQRLHPDALKNLTGRPAASIDWLVASLPQRSAGLPWRIAIADNKASVGHALNVDLPGRERRELVMNCSPINDGSRTAKGCLVTISDVTDLHERTRRLAQTLEALSTTQAEIRSKNEKLTLLATRDALTGCLNRGSFMAETDQRFAEAKANGTPACVIMCDIDHFKQVNDSYGHAGGDRVIQAVVKSLGSGLRASDLLGRYGGEEFCIMLPGATLAQALEVAERLRAAVEAEVGDALREPADVKVTMSFGVAQLDRATADPATLIDRADQALYLSKKVGRNRVTSEAALRAAQTEPETA
jgi:diguanylate cyclase (GGDEF)-like protein/PAS domain S-box-containing protein